MQIEIGELRYAQSTDVGQPTAEGWVYLVQVRLVPVDGSGQPLDSDALALLQQVGFEPVQTASVTVPAGEGGQEPTLAAVGPAVMQAIGGIVMAARQAWVGRTVRLELAE